MKKRIFSGRKSLAGKLTPEPELKQVWGVFFLTDEETEKLKKEHPRIYKFELKYQNVNWRERLG